MKDCEDGNAADPESAVDAAHNLRDELFAIGHVNEGILPEEDFYEFLKCIEEFGSEIRAQAIDECAALFQDCDHSRTKEGYCIVKTGGSHD